jgi:OFA family oxalate/formate antiporter-like MFS transporter
VGAVFFCSGYLVASFSQGNMWILFFGISIIAAFGMSLAYLTVLTTLMLWLPDRKGLATGLAMAGFGGGTILMSQIATPMLNNGMPVLEVFRIMGIILGAIFFICSFFISKPPHYEAEAITQSKVEYRQIVKDKRSGSFSTQPLLRPSAG